MSRSGSGKPDPEFEEVELLFHQEGGSASFGTKMAQSINGVDLGCMNPIYWIHLWSKTLKISYMIASIGYCVILT